MTVRVLNTGVNSTKENRKARAFPEVTSLADPEGYQVSIVSQYWSVVKWMFLVQENTMSGVTRMPRAASRTAGKLTT